MHKVDTVRSCWGQPAGIGRRCRGNGSGHYPGGTTYRNELPESVYIKIIRSRLAQAAPQVEQVIDKKREKKKKTMAATTAANIQADWQKVDMSAPDGGLASAYKVGDVHADVIEHLKTEEGVGNMRDFVQMLPSLDGGPEASKAREEEYKRILGLVQTVDKKKVHAGRLKSAWEASAMAWIHCQAKKPQTSDSPDDVEKPLPNDVQNEQNTAWKDRYDMTLDDHVDPGPTMVNRYHREFRVWCFTVPTQAKMRSKVQENEVHQDSTPMGGGLSLVKTSLPENLPMDVVDVYWSLRRFANGAAKAGNYYVPSKVTKGDSVIMFHLNDGLNFADRALRTVLKVGIKPEDAMDFLEKAIKVTMQCASNMIAREWPAGEALNAAVDKCANVWTIISGTRINTSADTLGVHASIVDSDGIAGGGGGGSNREVNATTNLLFTNPKGGNGGGKGNGKKAGKRGGRGKQGQGKDSFAKRNAAKKGPKRGAMSNHLPQHLGGGKVCGAYNSKKGCHRKESNCPQGGTHVCGFVVDDAGTPCGKRSCNFVTHSQGGW